MGVACKERAKDAQDTVRHSSPFVCETVQCSRANHKQESRVPVSVVGSDAVCMCCQCCNKQTANFLFSQTSVLLESICSFSFNHQNSLLSLPIPSASTYRLIPKPLHTLLTSHNLLQTCPRPVKPGISPTPPLTPSRPLRLSQLLSRTLPLFKSKPLVSHKQPRTVRYVHTTNPGLF